VQSPSGQLVPVGGENLVLDLGVPEIHSQSSKERTEWRQGPAASALRMELDSIKSATVRSISESRGGQNILAAQALHQQAHSQMQETRLMEVASAVVQVHQEHQADLLRNQAALSVAERLASQTVQEVTAQGGQISRLTDRMLAQALTEEQRSRATYDLELRLSIVEAEFRRELRRKDQEILELKREQQQLKGRERSQPFCSIGGQETAGTVQVPAVAAPEEGGFSYSGSVVIPQEALSHQQTPGAFLPAGPGVPVPSAQGISSSAPCQLLSMEQGVPGLSAQGAPSIALLLL